MEQISNMLLKILILAAAIILLSLTSAALYGSRSWQLETRELRVSLEESRLPIRSLVPNARESATLPEPVQRYFRAVLPDGFQVISAVNIRHTGTFNMSETAEEWKQFKSTQRVVAHRPGFAWEGRIRIAPLMTVNVLDAYVSGRGILTAKLFGLLTLAAQLESKELAEGELMRFLAEAVWYPTTLLPSDYLTWEAIAEYSARAILTDDVNTASLVFTFDAEGFISEVRADGRYRSVGGELIRSPWQGRFWNYQRRDGMMIPLNGEVMWVLPERVIPYCRGQIADIQYEYHE